MELFDLELDKARKRLSASGIDPGSFTFKRTFLPPDSDDGAMFTVRYEVRIARTGGGKVLTPVGGIGLDWVGEFGDALDEGYFG